MENNRLIAIIDAMEKLSQEYFSELRILASGERTFPYSPLPIPPITDEKLMDRLKVQGYLDISKTTYYRKVKEGKLKPMKLPGGHKYHKSDLLAEYNESKRRGRI